MPRGQRARLDSDLCVCTDRPVYTSGGAILLSLSHTSSTPGAVPSAASHDSLLASLVFAPGV